MVGNSYLGAFGSGARRGRAPAGPPPPAYPTPAMVVPEGGQGRGTLDRGRAHRARARGRAGEPACSVHAGVGCCARGGATDEVVCGPPQQRRSASSPSPPPPVPPPSAPPSPADVRRGCSRAALRAPCASLVPRPRGLFPPPVVAKRGLMDRRRDAQQKCVVTNGCTSNALSMV